MLHRVFIAINLPPNIKRILASSQKKLQKTFASDDELRDSVKWVLPDNFHITLEFLGNMSGQEILDLVHSLRRIAPRNEPFNITMSTISFGPLPSYEEWTRKIPKFIWVRGEPSAPLNKLFQSLENELFVQKKTLKRGDKDLEGEKEESRHFFPHITLARLRQWQFRKVAFDERPRITEEINLSFGVESIQIMESYLKKSGPIYTVLESVDLGSTNY